MNQVREATLELVGQALPEHDAGWPAESGTAPSFDSAVVDWHDVVSFASSHLVLAMLGRPGFVAKIAMPDEVAEFLGDVHAANRARNEMLKAQLVQIGDDFGRNSIDLIALKGGAFLADDTACDEAAACRFMSDLDVLVRPQELAGAVERLEGLGFQARSTDYDPEHHAHYPPLVSRCGLFSVEVHTRLFDRDDFGIDVDVLWREAKVASGGILVPAPRHRVAHALMHAQLHNRQHAARRIVLRDIADLGCLARIVEIDRDLVDDLFVEPLQRRAAGALVAAWQSLTGGAAEGGASFDQDARLWARCAIDRLGWTRAQSIACLPIDMLAMEHYRWANEPGHGRRRVSDLTHPIRLARNLQVWSLKQRQRLWA